MWHGDQEVLEVVNKEVVLKQKVASEFVTESKEFLRKLRLTGITTMIMNAANTILDESKLRQKMVEAQTILRKHKLLPNCLPEDVKLIYSKGLSMT